ncbi:MAG: Glycosyl transferase, WecB/TagA/CpsF family [Candidatus Shapirobacteria bacterium GW2011_GWE1_38_10]|uniref:Glycosyl transferase, WecB/TagA/CpsF family n=1 Tax=Candidatus Shapirobacteria bacterium GW2011_GWE1_38_10 TaxID=1618488 RepID=A0A0G0I1Z4_9BACT|nr:MAG: Glycosyl transferase, WecB/TagA/CpsF family [Candidatus Shapirobacteria bacterium GW2011_GWF2_37_20]KKQ49343.1 MAG: Glycosyl transferase, WecB/TagA/CpsF family [Candidatus Shapirobacteria bacterium GW2011_GWE1_38_10]KKQ65088.1 MAG: Glycosyl transferase, WecB/TagA/CpsF family [Candidatus Shapirobacteria bacterium GW2011_GWF1_38_23]
MKENRIILFDLGLSTLNLEETLGEILKKVGEKKGGRIYCCTLNEAVMASEDKFFKNLLNQGDVLTADGMPLVWLMKLRGVGAQRVYGPDLLKEFLILNKKGKIKCLFIGNKKNKDYFEHFGKYLIAPYKKKFTNNDFNKIAERVKKLEVDLVWVSLGGKKQVEVSNELSMRLSDKVFVTVGAAFDFLSGVKKQAPVWMRNWGLEWLFRLISEPKRLWRRYFKIGCFLLNRMSNRG